MKKEANPLRTWENKMSIFNKYGNTIGLEDNHPVVVAEKEVRGILNSLFKNLLNHDVSVVEIRALGQEIHLIIDNVLSEAILIKQMEVRREERKHDSKP